MTDERRPEELADERATVEQRAALDDLDDCAELEALDRTLHALTHAVLALEARVEELTCYVAKLG